MFGTPPKFFPLLQNIHKDILSMWIPNLEMQILNKAAAKAYNTPPQGDEMFPLRHHCVKINSDFLVFSLKSQQLRGIERAFIDWALGKALEYSQMELDEALEKSILEALPRLLIAACMICHEFGPQSPWEQFHDDVGYFGMTETLYQTKQHPEFSTDNMKVINDIFDVIQAVETMSESTNEGRKFPCTVAMLLGSAAQAGSDDAKWKDLIKKQYIKSLAGDKNIFILNQEGRYIDYKYFGEDYSEKGVNDKLTGLYTLQYDTPTEEFRPSSFFSSIINVFTKKIQKQSKEIFGVAAKTNGDILIYKNFTILFFKRKGRWSFLNYEALSDIVGSHSGQASRELINEISLTVIDMLIDQAGCCLGLIPEDDWIANFDDIMEVGAVDDLLSRSPSIQRCFWSNARSIRKKILSIDGAVTVEASTGELYCAGAIIPNSGASSQGARTTAAKEIAKRGGLGIKVSDDGYIEVFEPISASCIFNIGKISNE